MFLVCALLFIFCTFIVRVLSFLIIIIICKKIDSLAESQETHPKKSDIPLPLQIRAAVATGLGAAAGHAKLLAVQEEREIEHLVATIIEAQVG